MKETPTGMRLHIGIFGRRNVGKTSLLNALAGQNVGIVSDVPGTTTDVVAKPMEIKPIGPVLLLDTAGLDDIGQLGLLRVQRSRKTMERVDVAIVVCDTPLSNFEEELLKELSATKIGKVVVFNKVDQWTPTEDDLKKARELSGQVVCVSSKDGVGIDQLSEAIIAVIPQDYLDDRGILTDLVGPGDVVVLVVPIDLEAPKGRLILPQVQVIREVLDCDARTVVVKERELSDTLDLFKTKPNLVITDSQAILKVAADVPDDIPLTTFSILFARWKGDLESFIQGTQAIDTLKPGAKILIAETCSHHPIGEDIGRVKIPRWLRQYVGGELHFDHTAGLDFPDNLTEYSLIVQCGSCMTNRREVLRRILQAKTAGVPITNYGLCISKSLGVLKRALSPFS
ncbi:MAG: [FeFe] hydrogenase H-cluster maturation GTPase HydF [Phycisphaerae bacterium]